MSTLWVLAFARLCIRRRKVWNHIGDDSYDSKLLIRMNKNRHLVCLFCSCVPISLFWPLGQHLSRSSISLLVVRLSLLILFRLLIDKFTINGTFHLTLSLWIYSCLFFFFCLDSGHDPEFPDFFFGWDMIFADYCEAIYYRMQWPQVLGWKLLKSKIRSAAYVFVYVVSFKICEESINNTDT